MFIELKYKGTMKSLLFPVISVFLMSCSVNSPEATTRNIIRFQKELNEEYRNPEETPLRGQFFVGFTGHPFFPVNLQYRVKAKLQKSPNAVQFEMPTSSGKTKTFKEYGKVKFFLEGKELTLTVFQMSSTSASSKSPPTLFLPFRDLTNGLETYGGGRYLDFDVPTSAEVFIDFNKSYHPYCAYNAFDYNCPIVPAENMLPARIEAGVRYDDIYLK